MAGIARQGDIVGKGGILIGPVSNNVTVNGRPVALEACAWTPHPPCNPTAPQHCFGIVIAFDSGVTVNGVPPITKASIATCADPILTASTDVIVAESGFAQIAGMAAAMAGGDISGMSGLERIAYTAGGQIVSGADVGKTLEGAAISAGVSVGVNAGADGVKQAFKNV